MTNLAHWQDIDDALGGDFDGSLSGLCIMSLSFDINRNGGLSLPAHQGASTRDGVTPQNTSVTAAAAAAAAASSCTGNNQQQQQHQAHASSSGATSQQQQQQQMSAINKMSLSSALNQYALNNAHEASNESSVSNYFKRFKSAAADNDADDKSNTQNKIFLQLQQLKNCLNNSNQLGPNQAAISNPSNNSKADTPPAAPKDLSEAYHNDANATAPTAIENNEHQNDDADSRYSTEDIRSPSPSHSPSSIQSSAHSSSRSQSPFDADSLSQSNDEEDDVDNNDDDNNNNNNNDDDDQEPSGLQPCKSNDNNNTSNNNSANVNAAANRYRMHNLIDRHTSTTSNKASVASGSGSATPRDNQLSLNTFKETSYTTSVITTTAPMNYKKVNNKRNPLSPFHHLNSNSSLNHEFYDRYLSTHDSRQPLQTPLIRIERSQDFLSLKLPNHGADDVDTQRFGKDWIFDETNKQDDSQARTVSKDELDKTKKDDNAIGSISARRDNNQQDSRKDTVRCMSPEGAPKKPSGFPFNYNSSSSRNTNNNALVAYAQDCCNPDVDKDNNHQKQYDAARAHKNSCYDGSNSPPEVSPATGNNSDSANLASQYQGQESLMGIDPHKLTFHYVLASPISAATKINEDTMTYLNQGQAYEIKLENSTDLAEVKKGFMRSIINIGFYERHMQQAESELWQQWGQQHPNEKIFSVDMKLSYNVFGVESDGLNKYEFLWDSSKAAGVFLRINSISTEFTPKKHGGEKGVPFKLSIETFAYNSKTHVSYFISAACCQIKVFKPKGAERKIRSDKDKVAKRPLNEQDKYQKASDHTIFRECSLTSLHPLADGSLSHYRQSHGHFASKQIVSATNVARPSLPQQPSSAHDSNDDAANANSNHNDQPTPILSPNISSAKEGLSPAGSSNNIASQHNNNNRSSFSARAQLKSTSGSGKIVSNNYLSPNHRPATHSMYPRINSSEHVAAVDHVYCPTSSEAPMNESGPSNNYLGSDLLQPMQQQQQQQQQQSMPYPTAYHANNSRSVASLASLNTGPQFGVPYYASHGLSATVPSQLSNHASYTHGAPGNLGSIAQAHHSGGHNFSISSQQQHASAKNAHMYQRTYQQQDKSNSAALIPAAHVATPYQRASNPNVSNNCFQTYLSGHGDNNNHSNANLEAKDMPSNPPHGGGGNNNHHHNYQLDEYDPLHAQNHSTNLHSNGAHSFRQRSASTSFTHNLCSNQSGGSGGGGLNKPTNDQMTNANCANYHESHPVTNLWSVGPFATHAPLGGPKPNLDMLQHQANENFGYGPYECNNHNYNSPSQHDSPNKSHNISDSSSSCYSRHKTASTSNVMTPSWQHVAPYQSVHSTNGPPYSITAASSCHEVAAWFTANRFGLFAKTFANFSGSDLLRLSKTEMIEICGMIDGIRLYNSLHHQQIKPQRVFYVCHRSNDVYNPIYLYDVKLKELLKELTHTFIQDRRQESQQQQQQQLQQQQQHQHNKSQANDKMSFGSSSDSRSSIGAISTDGAYCQLDSNYNPIESTQRHSVKQNVSAHKIEDNHNLASCTTIERLFIEGIASVKIIATDQVVQTLDNESVWTLSLNQSKQFGLEACLTLCSKKSK